MLVVDSNGTVNFNTPDPKLFLSAEDYSHFLRILAESEINESTFLELETYCLVFIDSNFFLICNTKEVAGLRMSVFNNSKMDFALLNDMAWDRLELAAKHFGADLIQMEVPTDSFKILNSFSNVLVENYIFERVITSELLPVTCNIGFIDFNDQKIMRKLAELEFNARLLFPSATVRAKDKYSSILEEYLSYSQIPGLHGVSLDNDPAKGYMLWWSDPVKQIAVTMFAFIAPEFRGKGYGTQLTNAMINHMGQEKIKMSTYFVGATNTASVKNALKGGYKLNYFALNRQISKTGKI